MAIEIEGKLFRILPEQGGHSANGDWKKQDFVIETSGDYPKKVCFSLWGDKTSLLVSMQEGQSLKVSFEPNSREYNGKWYTDLRAWRVDKLGAANTGNNVPPPPGMDDVPPPTAEDDLPF